MNENITAVIVQRGEYRIPIKTANSQGDAEERGGFTPTVDGGSVVISLLDTEKCEPVGQADLYAWWDSQGIGEAVREKLQLTRTNFPSPVQIYDWLLERQKINFCEDVCESVFAGFDCTICPLQHKKYDMED
jgi:hypothetical protein